MLTSKKAAQQIIVFEGLIGSGKTTLLSKIKEYFTLTNKNLKIVVVPEPVKQWEQIGLLEEFYKDPKGKAYEAQTFICITRIEAIKKAYENNKDADVFLLERSIYSDRYFFVDLNIDEGNFTPLQKRMYERWWDLWKLILPIFPTKFVYLNPEIDECMLRLKRRGREGEELIPKSYQEKLKKKHDIFFKEKDYILLNDPKIPGQKVRIPSVIINSNEDFRNDRNLLKDIIDKIIDRPPNIPSQELISEEQKSNNLENILPMFTELW